MYKSPLGCYRRFCWILNIVELWRKVFLLDVHLQWVFSANSLFCKVSVVCLEPGINWTFGCYQAVAQIKQYSPRAVWTSDFPLPNSSWLESMHNLGSWTSASTSHINLVATWILKKKNLLCVYIVIANSCIFWNSAHSYLKGWVFFELLCWRGKLIVSEWGWYSLSISIMCTAPNYQ